MGNKPNALNRVLSGLLGPNTTSAARELVDQDREWLSQGNSMACDALVSQALPEAYTGFSSSADLQTQGEINAVLHWLRTAEAGREFTPALGQMMVTIMSNGVPMLDAQRQILANAITLGIKIGHLVASMENRSQKP